MVVVVTVVLESMSISNFTLSGGLAYVRTVYAFDELWISDNPM